MEALALDFSESSFDGLVAYYLLHYLPQRSWPLLLAGFSRVLRPGGLILIVMKKGEGEGWIADPMGGTVKTYWSACSQEEMELMITSAGFRLLKSNSRCPLPDEIAVERIYLQAECVRLA